MPTYVDSQVPHGLKHRERVVVLVCPHLLTLRTAHGRIPSNLRFCTRPRAASLASHKESQQTHANARERRLGLRVRRAPPRPARIRRPDRELRDLQLGDRGPVYGVQHPHREPLPRRQAVESRPIQSWAIRT